MKQCRFVTRKTYTNVVMFNMFSLIIVYCIDSKIEMFEMQIAYNENILVTCRAIELVKLQNYCETNNDKNEIKFISNKKIVSKIFENYFFRLNISRNIKL